MPLLSEIPDTPIGMDLRVDLPTAAQLRAPAAAYSLWPDHPFGASADGGVWPSVFVEATAATATPDRIALQPGEAAFWQAFHLWDDIREMAHHMRPLPIPTELVALGLDPDHGALNDEYALYQLARGRLTPETLELEATLLGYDITDEFLRSALFDAARAPGFVFPETPRSAYGLVETREAARALLKVLERDDPAHAPLVAVSVWSLGAREATPDA